MNYPNNAKNFYVRLCITLGLLALSGNLLLWGIGPGYFFRQIIFWFIGVLAAFLIVKVNFTLGSLRNYIFLFWGITLFLLFLPLFLGQAVRGSSRWIFISDQGWQPSELAKPFFVIFLACWLTNLKKTGFKALISTYLLIFPAIAAILWQPDLATALVFCFSATALLIQSKLEKKYLFLSVLMLLPVLFIAGKLFLADYQIDRLKTFLQPGHDPLGKGYNLLQAQVAFGSGQFLGRGLGAGSQTRLRFLPEYHTDFIFSSLGESFGFLGVTLVLVLYLSLFWSLTNKALSSNNDFCYLLKIGLLAYLCFQTWVNIGMNLGLLPVAGIPLPFFSYGGSSLVSSFVSIGLILKEA